jgi:hypothetical protein
MLEFLRKNPLLAGCFGVLGCFGLVVLFSVLIAGFGLKALTEGSQIAVLGASQAAAEEGLSFGYVFDNGDVVLDMIPQQPRELSCDELWAIVEPHILKPELPLTIRSQTAIVSEDGGLAVIPLECSRVADSTLEDELPEEVVREDKSSEEPVLEESAVGQPATVEPALEEPVSEEE